MTEAAITALMPVKDYHGPYLERAIGSILRQTVPNWRLLVIAEDQGREELSRLLHQALADQRVGLIVNEGRQLAGALNTGMRRATTPFAAIILADDMWAPQAVEVLSSSIERFPDVDFFHSSRAVIDELDRRIVVQEVRETVAPADFAYGAPVKHLLCWRRDTALAIGGMDETLNSVGPDDYDFPWSMADAGARFMAVPDCLYLYRDHRDCFRLTTHLPKTTHRRELRRIMRKHGVGPLGILRTLAHAQRHHLRQCLYRTPFDRWLKNRLGHDPHAGWRDYR